MRTTVTVDDYVLRQAKEEAARTGQTLGLIVEAALRERFARQQVCLRGHVTLPTFRAPPGKEGFAPGIDLDHMADTLDLLDEWDASH